MKILSYNLNGIRAAMKKGLLEMLEAQNADVVCFQELKAMADQFDVSLFEDLGYHCYWHSAEKKGYSGVGILTKAKPKHIEYGCGASQFDQEGRVIRADFDDFSVISAYFPSGTTGDIRQTVKYEFLDYMLGHVSQIKKQQPNLILAGDYNICHRPIDIHDPVRNATSSGFLPEEREWMSRFFDSGFVDSFRKVYPETPDAYSWWSYRANARNNNKGWRIDYISVTEPLGDQINAAGMVSEERQSDHCGIYADLAI